MKKTVLFILVGSLIVSAAMAQKPDQGDFPSHKKYFHHHHGRDLSKTLQFSDQQKEDLKSIRKTYYQKLAELQRNEGISVKEMRDQKAAMRKDYNDAFQQMLTSEQKQKLDEFRKLQLEKRKMAAARKLEKMKTRLNLTDEQTTKIRDLNEQFRDKSNKIKETTGERRGGNEQLMDLRKQHKAALEAVLTPDQQKKLEDLKKDRTGRF